MTKWELPTIREYMKKRSKDLRDFSEACFDDYKDAIVTKALDGYSRTDLPLNLCDRIEQNVKEYFECGNISSEEPLDLAILELWEFYHGEWDPPIISFPSDPQLGAGADIGIYAEKCFLVSVLYSHFDEVSERLEWNPKNLFWSLEFYSRNIEATLNYTLGCWRIKQYKIIEGRKSGKKSKRAEGIDLAVEEVLKKSPDEISTKEEMWDYLKNYNNLHPLYVGDYEIYFDELLGSKEPDLLVQEHSGTGKTKSITKNTFFRHYMKKIRQ